MPELPEVETIKRDLASSVTGKKITGVDFLWDGIVKGMPPEVFAKNVVGETITAVERRAKNILIKLGKDKNLLMHMKMTGHLIVVGSEWEVDELGKWVKKGEKESPLYDPLNQYIRLIFRLSDGKNLAFSDLRKFAYVKLLDDVELSSFLGGYGPEPLSRDFTLEYLRHVLSGKKIPIKKVLMDQALIAGIGNIYADEILYEAKIHPLKPASEITADKTADLYKAIQKILTKAVELRGTSISDFRDTKGKKGEFEQALKVYRQTGKPCHKDGTVIKRIVVGGRGTHFCPKEQTLD